MTTFSFLDQDADSAVVPLLGAPPSPYNFEEKYCINKKGEGYARFVWRKAAGSEMAASREWYNVWGLFKVQLPNDTRLYVAEAACAFLPTIPSFCGGGMAAGFGIRVWHPLDTASLYERSSYFSHLSYFGRCRPNMEYSEERVAKLPSLNAHLSPAANASLTREQAKKILQRSLLFWMHSCIFAQNKRGVGAYDIVRNELGGAYKGYARDTLSLAPTLPLVIAGAPRILGTHRDRRFAFSKLGYDDVPEGEKLSVGVSYSGGWDTVPFTRKPFYGYSVLGSFGATPEWTNRNSQRRVAYYQSSIEARGLTNEEIVRRRQRRDYSDNDVSVFFPEVWHKEVSKIGYLRMFPYTQVTPMGV